MITFPLLFFHHSTNLSLSLSLSLSFSLVPPIFLHVFAGLSVCPAPTQLMYVLRDAPRTTQAAWRCSALQKHTNKQKRETPTRSQHRTEAAHPMVKPADASDQGRVEEDRHQDGGDTASSRHIKGRGGGVDQDAGKCRQAASGNARRAATTPPDPGQPGTNPLSLRRASPPPKSLLGSLPLSLSPSLSHTLPSSHPLSLPLFPPPLPLSLPPIPSPPSPPSHQPPNEKPPNLTHPKTGQETQGDVGDDRDKCASSVVHSKSAEQRLPPYGKHDHTWGAGCSACWHHGPTRR